MKLFLGGGGSGKDSIELDKKFVASLDLSKPLLYIPIATNTEKYPYSGCVEWLSSVLEPLGVRNIIMWVEEDLKEKTERDFEQFSGIYIGGGNTFKLLKEFGTFAVLKKFAEKDISIYGGSAGAIILAKTITPAGYLDQNKVGLNNFDALNLVHGYDIWCHYESKMDRDVGDYMDKFSLKKIIAIPETSGLFVSESIIEIVGLNPVVVFSNNLKTTIHPRQQIPT